MKHLFLMIVIGLTFSQSVYAQVSRPERKLLRCFLEKSRTLGEENDYMELGALFEDYKNFYKQSGVQIDQNDFFEKSSARCRTLKSSAKLSDQERIALIKKTVPHWSGLFESWVVPTFDNTRTKVTGLLAAGGFFFSFSAGINVHKSFRSDGRRIYYLGPCLGGGLGVGGFVRVRPSSLPEGSIVESKNFNLLSAVAFIENPDENYIFHLPGHTSVEGPMTRVSLTYPAAQIGLFVLSSLDEVSVAFPVFTFRNWQFIKDQILSNAPPSLTPQSFVVPAQ